MGNMIELSILTDGFDQVEKHPKRFVEKVKEGGLYVMASDHKDTVYGIGNHANCLTIHPAHHADEPRVYLAHANRFVRVDEYGCEERIRTSYRQPDDHFLDAVEDDIDSTIRKLQESKRYVRYLRDHVGFDERPGMPDYPMFGHHTAAWRAAQKGT